MITKTGLSFLRLKKKFPSARCFGTNVFHNKKIYREVDDEGKLVLAVKKPVELSEVERQFKRKYMQKTEGLPTVEDVQAEPPRF